MVFLKIVQFLLNPIRINTTNTQESNSWPVAEVNCVPLIIKVQTPRQTNPRFAVLWQGPTNRILQYETTTWREAEQVFQYTQMTSLSPIQIYK